MQFLIYESELCAELTQWDTFTHPALPTNVPEKTEDILVPHSSGGIKSLYDLYVDSKKAMVSACHQQSEGFNLPGISAEGNTIPQQKLITHSFSETLKCSLSYQCPE